MRRHRLHARVGAAGQVAHGLDALLDVLLHRLRDPSGLLDDQLAVLADPHLEGVDDLLVAVGERLERCRHLPADLVQLRADLTDAERRGAEAAAGAGLEGVGAAGDLLAGRADRLGEHVHRVLDPAGPGREGLEPFVRMRDQGPDRLVARELLQDRRGDGLLVAPGAPPDLAGDLVHQRVGGVLDRPQALVELLLDHLLVGRDHELGPLGGRRRQTRRQGRWGRLGTASEEAAPPRPITGRGGRVPILHVGARIPGPARRVRESVGEAGCNITHIGDLGSGTFRAWSGGEGPADRVDQPGGVRPGSAAGTVTESFGKVASWSRIHASGACRRRAAGSSRRGRRRATAGRRRAAGRRSARTGRPRGPSGDGLPRADYRTDLREPEERGRRSGERSFAAPSGPPYTWQPSPRLPAGPVLRRGVAQPGRAPVSKTGGWGFESLRPCKEHDEQRDEAGAAPSGHPGRACPGRCRHASGAAPAEEEAHGRPPVPEGGPSGAEEGRSGPLVRNSRRTRSSCSSRSSS